MLKFRIYIKLVYSWVTVFFYIVIRTFFESHVLFMKGKNLNFMLYLMCLMLGITSGITVLYIMDLYNLFPNFDFSDFPSNPILPNQIIPDYILNEETIKKEIEFQNELKRLNDLQTQKELEEIHSQTKAWIITTFVVYVIFFYLTTSYK